MYSVALASGDYGPLGKFGDYHDTDSVSVYRDGMFFLFFLAGRCSLRRPERENITIDRFVDPWHCYYCDDWSSDWKAAIQIFSGRAQNNDAFTDFFTISFLQSGYKVLQNVTHTSGIIGGYYFPFICLVQTHFAVNDEPQIKKICWFFMLFGAYLTLTAWAEYFKIWSIVFPKYILDLKLRYSMGAGEETHSSYRQVLELLWYFVFSIICILPIILRERLE
jgi:hypothetical protein